MSRDEAIWIGAGHLARVAMGVREHGRGRAREIVYEADHDPLAWWCLTQAIHDLATHPVAFVEHLRTLTEPRAP